MTLTRQRHDGTSQFPRHSFGHDAKFGHDAELPLFPTNISAVKSRFLTIHAVRLVAATAFLSATVAVFASPAAARTRKPVGVPGWTRGSQTYLRARPGEQTPAVAKVPRHTKVYVWGTFQGWYRVETPDHVFGWVHHSVLNAPESQKLGELSHRKAISASNRTATQKMYEVSDSKGKSPKAQSSTRLAISKRAPVRAMILTGSKTEKSVAKPTAAQTLAQKAAELRALESKTNMARAQLIQAQQEAARASRSNASQQNASQLLAAQVAAREKAVRLQQQRVAKAQADAKLEEAAHQSRWAQKQLNLRTRLAQQEKERQGRIAAYQIRLANERINAEARRQKRVANWKARDAARKNRMAWRQGRANERRNRLALERAQLRRNLETSSSTRSAAINVQTEAPSVLRPLTPAELMKAREEYLNQSRSAQPAIAAGTSTISPLNSGQTSDAASTGDASSASLSPSSFSSSMSSLQSSRGVSMLVLPSSKVAEKVASAKKATAKSGVRVAARPNVLASRGGSPMMRLNRGGSPRDYMRKPSEGSLFGQTMVKQALTYRGMPYIMGAASPGRGFDCSGLIYFMLRQRGYNPPRTAEGLSHYGVSVARNQLQPGDILLFANTYKRGISHAGIYMGNGNFVHAANRSRGVSTNSLGERYYASKYWGARRIK